MPAFLSLLDAPMGSAVPPTLTAWDMSFLKALYAATRHVYADAQRAEMRRSIAKDLMPPVPRQ